MVAAYAAGSSGTDVAAEFKVSPASVRRWVRAAGGTVRRKGPYGPLPTLRHPNRARGEMLLARGMPVTSVAYLVRASHQSVSAWRKQMAGVRP